MNADGFVRSEGCGVVVVKRLSDAIKDQNTIHAVIKSIVMNQDGGGTSLVAPNINAQIEMHQAALEQAQIKACNIDYIETHGAGTVIGDRVEFNAIQSIHQGQHSKDKPLVIGALKSNLGHTMSSSGIASLIKVICAFKHETIPPNLHYSSPNKSIDPECIPALLPVQAIPFLKHDKKKRIAQVSNFGFSGTNVSVIIEEPPAKLMVSVVDKTESHCFVVSANTEYALKQMMTRYVHYLKESSSSLRDICSTLINCRDHYKFRCAIIADDKQTLIKKIESEDYEWTTVANVGPRPNLQGYNKVDLPLYYFDRKSYWHEPRKKTTSVHWLDGLYQQSKEQQIETIKTKVAIEIQAILNQEHIDEYQDFESLGLTKPLLDVLDNVLHVLFLQRYKMSSPSYLTLDKLARHLQQIIMPAPVHRQPAIHVLNIEPIAIIGMSCRFPKAANINAFLSLLERGESGMSDIPLERWDNAKYYDADPEALGRLYIKQLGFIDHVKHFDADFFNISPREAKLMAPQLRVFMETCYHAIEDANLSLDVIKDTNTGVFVGVGTNEYPSFLTAQGVSLEELNVYFATGNVLNALAGRVAYAFDFHGPTQAIDTACSSSMTAIHNACLSLQSGDCNMAIAGGVNILLTPESNITLSKARMLSPDSRCKTFSEDADGYARSEGSGVLVLKRLSTAIKDNDNILAVIKGSSVNSDGQSGGFTVPNGSAQEALIRSALAKANLEPGDIDYIEAHGTGTPLADPIEVNTLTKIFSEHHSADNPLYISSVKTNIGHCESASGVSGVIKAVLSLQTKTLFKHLNFKKLNPWIQLDNSIIPLSNVSWNRPHGLRCVGVSSFGFSGSNAHVILQEASAKKKAVRALPETSLLVLSAKSKAALELLLSSYQQYLSKTNDAFADICYTAATCRSHFLFRAAIKASTAEQAAAIIEQNELTIYQIKNERDLTQKPHTLDQLQTAYQDGFNMDWLAVYQSLGGQFEKVKLPLYEFARVEHWFEDKDKLKDAQMPKNWCFQVQWEQQAEDKTNPTIRGDRWLLIGAKHLQSSFVSQGLQVVLEEDNYALDKLDGIIFAAGQDSIKTLLNLVKDLNHNAIDLQLVVLTTNAIPELAVGPLNMSHSIVVGFCKTLVLELPQFNTILIDLDNLADTLRDVSGAVTDEIKYNHGQCYEHMIAYRDGKRLVARLKQTPLIDKKRSLHGEGRYLVTGGCGGLGLITAQALLSAGARELILTSRQVDKPELNVAIRKVRSDYPGRIIRAVSLDVTDKENLGRLLLELNTDGLLKGIIHAAGAAIKAPLIEHQDADVDYLFSAKVTGALYLHELSQHCELDFFVVYSSIASVFGSNKESVYGAANSFLDALIAERQRLGLVGTAIQWGPWGEVGMAKKRAKHPGLKQALIDNEQGHALIKILINGQLSHAAIISPDFLKFMLDFVPKPLPAFHKYLACDLGGSSSPVKNTAPRDQHFLNSLRQHTRDECIAILGQTLREITTHVLELDNIDQISVNDDLFSKGLDSLMSVEIRNRIHDQLKCQDLTLSLEYFINDPCIDKIARYIADELQSIFGHAVDQLPSEDASINEIDLCDFQYVFWILNKLDYSFNIGMQLQLHGKINQDYIFQAFDFVVTENNAFWINFNETAPTQMLKKQGQFELIFIDLFSEPQLSGSGTSLNQEFNNNIMRIIPLTQQPLIRVYLYKINHDLHELHIVIPNIIADGTACDIVFNQFKNNYEALVLGKKLIQVPSMDSYFNYVKHNNHHYEKNLQDKIEFWQAYNKNFKLLYFGRAYHLPDAGSHQPTYLYHYPLTSKLIDKFINWHTANNINVSTGLVAACQIVFYKLSRQKKIPLILLHPGREGSQYKSVVGVFAEYKRINTTVNKQDNFIDCIKSIEEQLLKTAAFQKCSRIIKDAGLKGSQLSLRQSLAFIFRKSFLTRHFKESKLNATIVEYYVKYFSQILSIKNNISFRYKFNKLFNRDLPLLKPDSMRVIINITPSFFTKELEYMRFADLSYTYPSHFGCEDRPVGNKALWVHFSQNPHGDYMMSINGPLTTYCKDQIADDFNTMISKFLESEDCSVGDLVLT